MFSFLPLRVRPNFYLTTYRKSSGLVESKTNSANDRCELCFYQHSILFHCWSRLNTATVKTSRITKYAQTRCLRCLSLQTCDNKENGVSISIRSFYWPRRLNLQIFRLTFSSPKARICRKKHLLGNFFHLWQEFLIENNRRFKRPIRDKSEIVGQQTRFAAGNPFPRRKTFLPIHFQTAKKSGAFRQSRKKSIQFCLIRR